MENLESLSERFEEIKSRSSLIDAEQDVSSKETMLVQQNKDVVELACTMLHLAEEEAVLSYLLDEETKFEEDEKAKRGRTTRKKKARKIEGKGKPAGKFGGFGSDWSLIYCCFRCYLLLVLMFVIAIICESK